LFCFQFSFVYLFLNPFCLITSLSFSYAKPPFLIYSTKRGIVFLCIVCMIYFPFQIQYIKTIQSSDTVSQPFPLVPFIRSDFYILTYIIPESDNLFLSTSFIFFRLSISSIVNARHSPFSKSSGRTSGPIDSLFKYVTSLPTALIIRFTW